MNREVGRFLSRSPEMRAYDQIMTALSLLARGATAKITVDGLGSEGVCVAIPEPVAIAGLRQMKAGAGNSLAVARRLAEHCFDKPSRAKQ